MTGAARPQREDPFAYFLSEATEHLDIMGQCLLAVEQGRGGDENVNSLFRAVHTLKGAAYVAGQVRVGDLAHRIEDVLAAARSDPAGLPLAAIDAIQAGLEATRCLLGLAEPSSPDRVRDIFEEALARLATATVDAEARARSAPAAPTSRSVLPPDPAALPTRETLAGTRLDLLVSLAGELVAARRRLDGRVRELERVVEALSQSRAQMARAVGEFEDLQRIAAGPHTLPGARDGWGGRGLDAERGRPVPIEISPRGERALTDVSPALFSELEMERFDRADTMSRSLSEITADLAVAQAQVAALGRGLSEDSGWIRRLTGSLRGEIMRARLVPMGRMFTRVATQVRDTARAASKSVALEVTGESVEVDNAIVDQMAGPILHLLQNAIVHGIESESERRARGKPREGRLSVRASHRGGSIYIEISDDGRGVDLDLVKAEAVRRGLVPSEVTELMDESEALDLLFLPGFSTASAVTRSAGRGMGLDVVRATVGRLNGEVAVATEAGAGTRFSIRLPVTIIVSEAVLVRVGAHTLGIPVNAVKRIATVPADRVQPTGWIERVWVDGQPLELLRLDRLLGAAPGHESARLCVVALRAAGRAVAVAVDELLGKEEIVVRRLGDFLGDIGPFGGATISEAGQIILLLDPARLLESAGVASTDVPPAAAPAPIPAVAQEPQAAGRVLLVDDSISVRKFISQMLERAGFTVFTAADGIEGLQALDETPVSVVVTDLEMPRLNGFELIQELRRRAATRDLPIVVLTTRVGAKHLNLARWLGATEYVAKPVDEPAFVRLIDSLVAKSGDRSPGAAV